MNGRFEINCAWIHGTTCLTTQVNLMPYETADMTVFERVSTR